MTIKISDLRGKRIKRITDNCLYTNGCLIEFTDGIIISLRTTEYEEGGYADTLIEEITHLNKKGINEWFGEIKK